jgi:hypothetical protein
MTKRPAPRVVRDDKRYVTGLRGEPISAVAALGVASPDPGRRTPLPCPVRLGTVVD